MVGIFHSFDYICNMLRNLYQPFQPKAYGEQKAVLSRNDAGAGAYGYCGFADEFCGIQGSVCGNRFLFGS